MNNLLKNFFPNQTEPSEKCLILHHKTLNVKYYAYARIFEVLTKTHLVPIQIDKKFESNYSNKKHHLRNRWNEIESIHASKAIFILEFGFVVAHTCKMQTDLNRQRNLKLCLWLVCKMNGFWASWIFNNFGALYLVRFRTLVYRFGKSHWKTVFHLIHRNCILFTHSEVKLLVNNSWF